MKLLITIILAVVTVPSLQGQGNITNTLGSGGIFTVKGYSGDSLLVVKDTNGRVGVGSVSPSEKLEVNGNLKVTGSVKLNTTTRYASVAGGAFTPSNSGATYQKAHQLLYGLTSNQALVFFAPVSLPHGAIVTNFSATVYDNDSSQDIIVEFYSVGIYFKCQSSGTPGDVTLTPTVSASGAVDNQNDAFVVRAAWTTPSTFTDIKLYRATITYTITNPLP